MSWPSPKSASFGDTFVGNQNVIRFDISMDQVFVVGMTEAV